MTRNQVTKLWSAIVTVFLTLCTTLGLITTTAAAAVPQTGPSCNGGTTTATAPTHPYAEHDLHPWSRSSALPPTMKQRIRAEAHGSSPSCRHRHPDDAAADASTEASADASTATPDTAADPAAVRAQETPAKPDAPLTR
jgi:hypothetical protein